MVRQRSRSHRAGTRVAERSAMQHVVTLVNAAREDDERSTQDQSVSRRQRLRRVGLIATIGSAAMFAVVGAIRSNGAHSPDQPLVSKRSEASLVVTDVARHRTSASRVVYRHSVVRGGVFTAGEVQDAVTRDDVVARHYAGIVTDKLRTRMVLELRPVYVSYRIGDEIYWTRHKLSLHEGERVLTDGINEIRARCGNRISEIPMGPTSPNEPESLDAIDFAREPLGSRRFARAVV